MIASQSLSISRPNSPSLTMGLGWWCLHKAFSWERAGAKRRAKPSKEPSRAALDRLHEGTRQVEELLPALTGVPASGLGQLAGLAQEMRQAANAVEVRAVNCVTISHQVPRKAALQGIDEDLGAACTDEIHHCRHGVEHPQSHQHVAFSPRRLVHVDQTGALDFFQQEVLDRGGLTGTLP